MCGDVKILLIILMLGLTACEDSGGDNNDEKIQDDTVTVNVAPSVNAGSDIIVELPERVELKGAVTDDGLPNNSLTFTWSQTAGPSSAAIATPKNTITEVSFKEAGVYSFSLLGDDSEMFNRDDVQITVVDTQVKPTENMDGSEGSDSENIGTKEHSSGLRLEFIKDEVLADSTDIDWMYRMWEGIAQCHRQGATAAYPTIRLSLVIAPLESGDLASEGDSSLYRFNLEKEFIEVLNTSTSPIAGSNQGLVLGEAMSWYMGLQTSDNWQGTDCAMWHSGGRHKPSPGRDGIRNIDYIFDISLIVSGLRINVKSDTTEVDDFALSYIGNLWSSVAKCHGHTEAQPADITEILVVTGSSEFFAGDKWNETGSYTVNDGGQIVIDSRDLVDIRTNKGWGKGLHHWMNRYLDAYADRFRPIYECRDLSGTYSEPALPIQFD